MTITQTRRPRGGLLLTVALPFALGVAGCSDDDSSAEDDGSTGTPTPGSSDGSGGPASTSSVGSTGGDATDGTTGGDATDGTTGGDATDDTAGDESGTTGGDALEIAGDWIEVFADDSTQAHAITERTWTQTSMFGTFVFHVDDWDNDLAVLVAQGDAANDFNPELYSRFEWTWDDADELYYCQSVYDAATAQDAWDAEGADASDLLGGCSGFPWSALMPDPG